MLSFVRVDRRERDSEDRSALAVLCVNNLSSRPQSTTITLPEELWDWETRDLFGGSGFPDIAPDGTDHHHPRVARLLLARPGAATR